MLEFLLIYVEFYTLGLMPLIAIALVMLFVPLKRLPKAGLVSAAAIFTATPVTIPIGWGVVIAPVSWAAILSPTGVEFMLLNASMNWPLQACSVFASAVIGLLIGYYALPRSRFNRPHAAPNDPFKPTHDEGL